MLSATHFSVWLLAGLGSLATAAAGSTPALPNDAVIIFQGDSITDAGRDRKVPGPNDAAALARGYVGMLADELLAPPASPGLRIYNRGVSGDRCTDLLGRWRRDTLALKPDLVSILVGVNDTWHQYLAGTGISVENYTAVYRLLLQDVRRQNPQCRLVLCEPFALPGGAFKPEWMDELRARSAAVRQLARDFDATFVPFQAMFDEAMKTHPAAELAADGVHPSALGYQLMAAAWRKATGL